MKNLITLITLITLTLLTGWLSTLGLNYGSLAVVAIGLAVIKLFLVAFQFMELKHAHVFWKSALILFCITFLAAITLVTH